MAVKMLTGMAGDTWSVKPGDKFVADAAYEARLIASGQAEPWPEVVLKIEGKPESKAKGKK